MLKKFSAILVVLIFVLLAVPFTFVWNVYSNLTDEDFYQGKLVDYGYDLLIEELPKTIKLEQFHSLTEDDLRGLIEKVFFKDDLRFLITDFVKSLGDVKEENGEIHLKIPLSKFNSKDVLIARELTVLLYEKLPLCTGIKSEGECIPANLSKIDFQAQLKMELDRTLFANIPDSFVIKKTMPKQFNGDFLGTIQHSFDLFFWVGTSLLVFLLVVLALIIWKPWKKVVIWEAGALYICFFVYTLAISIFKVFGGIGGIVGHSTNLDLPQNQSVKFGLEFVDLILDHGASSVRILFIGIASFFVWLIFSFWNAGQNKVELKSFKGHKP